MNRRLSRDRASAFLNQAAGQACLDSTFDPRIAIYDADLPHTGPMVLDRGGSADFEGEGEPTAVNPSGPSFPPVPVIIPWNGNLISSPE